MYIINFIRGFVMAMADSVPGVSGGTIAFIMGFYDKFIGSLNSLVGSKDKEERKEAIIFLFKLALGWVVGFVLAVLVLSSVFNTHIYEVSSLFIGLTIFSIPLIISEEKSEIVNKYRNIIFTVIGIALVAGITYFNPVASGDGSTIKLDSFNIKLAIYVFAAGMIAISAMVLPGISGSTLLLILGIYTPIITSIKEVLTLNFASLPILISFGLGVIAGIVCTIKVIKYLLETHRSKSIYLIIGLMIGSVYAIIMGPTTIDAILEPISFNNFSIIYFLIGGSLIFGLEKLRVVLEKKLL
ncbi:DUF368 domain-containing protein [Clostridium gasigenes]|uniref:DUF368 domain-containing protein n=1 Tax=Clostridium gasigenes TaxID=94869 RepID=UPI001C0C9A4C|nr:DUF368 domain-containing protein [Clostridium gasigenes]MBU3109197.1 DUF368 domain-containing protein [Clostridium gasigenes]